MLQLPKRVIAISIDDDRMEMCSQELEKLQGSVLRNATPTPAVVCRNGAELKQSAELAPALEEFHSLWSEAGGSWNRNLTVGELGCSLAHIDALRMVADGKAVTAVVEDDFIVGQNQAEILKVFLCASAGVGTSFLLRVGQCAADPKAEPTATRALPGRRRLVKGTLRHGTHFYIVNPQGAKAILAALQDNPALLDLPADIWMSHAAVEKATEVWSFDPALVGTRPGVVSTTAPPHQ
jgi:GR25 family glycosyltransferase involved in LPS biosynthesis